jgi:hypothetical protein
MPLVVNIAAPFSARRSNPYAGLHGLHAALMLDYYKNGAKLYVWRGSSPHNWWLETTEGISHTVCGDRETNGILGVAHLNIPGTLTRLGRKVFTSPERIAPHTLHRDGGQPYKEGWEFDTLRVATLEAEWAEVLAAIEIRKNHPPSFQPDLSALSEEALALLRTLKKVDGLYPFDELLGAFAELDKQGFLLMNGQGAFHLHDEAKALVIPRGQSLRLKFPPARH